MPVPLRPTDEAHRQHALESTGILDTGSEERFERLARLAQRYFDAPMVFITFLDGDRQWFKSCQGMEATEAPRDISFCGHTILGDQILCVPDATLDERFADNPLVTESPNIRFYAGAPIRTVEGYRIGTLCIADTKPRQMQDRDIGMLRDLADCVENEVSRSDRTAAETARLALHLTAVLETVVDAIVSIDVDGTIRTLNSATERMFQFTQEELLGSNISSLMIEDEKTTHNAHIRRYLETGDARIIGIGREVTGRRKDGSVFPMELSVGEMHENGQRQFVGVVRDLSLRKTQESFLDAIVENIPNMVFVKEAGDLRFTLFNRAGEELLGIPRAEMIGKNDYDFFPKSQADFFVDKDREVLEYNGPIEIAEEPLQTTHGERILHTRKVAIRDGAGVPRYLLGISEDVTERKRIERDLAKSLERAERASRGKTEFLAHMSHELRSPLNVVIGFAQMMQEKLYGELHPKYADYADNIQSSAQHLLELINDILDVSKIESGEFSVQESEFDLAEPATAAVNWVGVNALEKRLNLSNEIEQGALFLRADIRLIRQIFINLLWNAIKFTPEDGEIRVSGSVNGDGCAILTVSDTGIGMASEDIPTALEPFGQVRASPMQASEGTGLGLSLTKQMAELHGGVLSIESEVGVGTTVSITLPSERTSKG